jgi:hypothetical protein
MTHVADVQPSMLSKRSALELGVPARVACAILYLATQCALLVYAQKVPDHVFGFQMFNASSDMRISLFRRVQYGRHPRLIAVQGGAWQARDARGEVHTVRWNDRVRDGVLGHLDGFVHASYGLDAQLFRLQYALDDFVAHMPDDRETRALVAVVEVVKNGISLPAVRLIGERH